MGLFSLIGQLIKELATDSPFGSTESERKILKAINDQRWYFFKNKPSVLMDRDTGLLWANLDAFAWYKDGNKSKTYTLEEAEEALDGITLDGYLYWDLPTFAQFKEMIEDKTFPFQIGEEFLINGQRYWRVKTSGNYSINLGSQQLASVNRNGYLLPCSDVLVRRNNYEYDVSNPASKLPKREKLERTVDLFVKNDLIPIFEDDEVTGLFEKIYYEERRLEEERRKKEEKERLRKTTMFSSEFNYEEFLSEYNPQTINSSVIKYFQALEKLTDEFEANISYYESENKDLIQKFNYVGLELLSQYEKKEALTDDENSLLEARKTYFQSYFAFGINTVKSKIQTVRKEADILEQCVNGLENTEDIYQSLTEIEQEKRPSFSFLTDYLVKVIRQAMKKMEFFESHQKYIETMVDISQKWDADYQVFKTSQKEKFKQICEDDSIEEEIWSVWYQDWQKVRLLIEGKIQPAMEYGLKAEIETVNPDEGDTVERLLQVLGQYKGEIDKFYLEERRHIYENYAFQSGGELQDKLQTEKTLYTFTANFQAALQDIIFNCKNADDRVFILNWANDLLDIQIDEILAFVEDNSLQQISKTILDGFAELKQKNFDVYLSDAKAYADEKARREKEYNSLVFKMRKAK